MQEKLIKITMICTVFFTVLSMTSIVYAASGKAIEIADVAQDEVARGQGTGTEDMGQGKALNLQETGSGTGYLTIPLPAGIKAESVSVENHYMNNELWVVLSGGYGKYYAEAELSSGAGFVTAGYYEEERYTTRLKFKLNAVYEYRSVLEENSLYVEFVPPAQMYEKRVVIDPACGGKTFGKTANNLAEKNVALLIAEKVKDKLDRTDIKVYYTRVEDIDPGEDARIALAAQVDADMLIRIEVNASEEEAQLGTETVYNGTYFIPGFGSTELADLLEREVVTAIQGKAVGLVLAGADDYVIGKASVPAAAVRVGYITNDREAQLLANEEYLNKIAEGICQTILKAYNIQKD